MDWIVGVDGGGSKTTACAADMSGNVLGRVDKGPANYHTTGLPAFQALIGGIIDAYCRDCGLDRNDLRLVSLGLAGVDRERDRDQIMAALAGLGLPCRFLISNDAVIALTAGLGRAEGIVLIAGTGSIAYGVAPEGRSLRAGGLGPHRERRGQRLRYRAAGP